MVTSISSILSTTARQLIAFTETEQELRKTITEKSAKITYNAIMEFADKLKSMQFSDIEQFFKENFYVDPGKISENNIILFLKKMIHDLTWYPVDLEKKNLVRKLNSL
jgi:hypothetical protein